MTGMVATKVLVLLLIRETVLDPSLEAYTSPFAGSQPNQAGFEPTTMVAITVFVELLITDTVLDPMLPTYTLPLTGS